MTRICLLLLLTCAVICIPVDAATIFTGTLTGTQEVPPNASPATGSIVVRLTGNILDVDLNWAGLVGGPPAAAHIHCCTAPGSNIGVAVGFPSFPALTTGAYSNSFDLLDASVYGVSFLNNFGGGTAAGAMAALLAGMNAGQAYANIHNATFPGGEIRADLQGVPEPSAAILAGMGLLGLASWVRRKRST